MSLIKKKIDSTVVLSTLWIFAMLNYLYCDVMAIMDSNLKKEQKINKKSFYKKGIYNSRKTKGSILKIMSMWIISVLVFILLSGCNDPKYLKTIAINEPDLSKIEDGEYKGYYKLNLPPGYFIGQPSAEVSVTVKDNKMVKIDLFGPIKNNLQTVAEQIIKEQKIDYDAITSGTFTKIP